MNERLHLARRHRRPGISARAGPAPRALPRSMAG